MENRITSERIKKVMDYIKENNPIVKNNNRNIVAYRGCINSNELVNALYDCGDANCPGCTLMRNAIQEELDKQIKNIHGK